LATEITHSINLNVYALDRWFCNDISTRFIDADKQLHIVSSTADDIVNSKLSGYRLFD